MHVRTQAAELLGEMSSVSEEFLHQTLDKKLMSNMRVRFFLPNFLKREFTKNFI